MIPLRNSQLLKFCLGGWILLVALGLGILTWPEKPRILLVPNDHWETQDGFFPYDAAFPQTLPTTYDGLLYRSWSPGTGAARGVLTTKEFKTQAPILVIPIVGYPSAPGNLLYVEKIATGERHNLTNGNAHELWQEYVFRLPSLWRGTPLQVVAESRDGTSYVGIGSPAAAGWITWLKQSTPVVVALAALICIGFVLLCRPLVTLLRCMLPMRSERWQWVMLPVAASITGYASFFGLYYAARPTLFAMGILTIAGAWLCRHGVLHLLANPARFMARRPCVLLWLVVTTASLLVLHAGVPVSLPYGANYRFTPASWSTDNQLPVITAQELIKGNRLSEWHAGPWLISDRPPALAGVLAPLAFIAKAASSTPTSSKLTDWILHIAGATILSMWILPVWVVLRRAGLPGWSRTGAVILMATTPFLFFNTVYIWPKLWSATLVMTAWLIVADWHPKQRLIGPGIVAGMAFGGAMACHGSIAFSIVGIGVLFIRRFLLTHWRLFAVCGAVFLALTIAWPTWGKHYAPPGDALTKSAFAGTFGWDSPDKGLGETVREAYSKDTPTGWGKRKTDGILCWLGMKRPITSHLAWLQQGNEVRANQFYHIVPSMGILILPLLLAPLASVSLKNNQRRAAPNFEASTFFLLGLAGLLIQWILLWHQHVLHHYAYGTLLFLHLAAIIYIFRLKPILRRLISLASITAFAWLWLLSPLQDFDQPVTLGLPLALILLAAGARVLCLPKSTSLS